MDINFTYGVYFQGRLFQISVDLNTEADYYKRLKQILKIKRVKDIPFARIGLPNQDGGYLMLNDLASDRGIAYSFGICNDVSWDNIMAELGYNIFMYDHTIEKLPYERKEFHFFNEGIAGKDEPDLPLKTLKYYIDRNGHSKEKGMILKIDVEGAEWDFLETTDTGTLKQFDQIVFEFHKIIQAGYSEKVLKLLEKLNKTHQLVHLHGNNSGYLVKIGDTTFPDVLEATYVIKGKYDFEDDDEITLPLPEDSPNDRGRPDVVLGKWNHPFILNK